MNAHISKKNLILQNIMASVTVSFVALSLGAAFGILSGRGAFAGMISAALIAIITSLFGGTRIQCSGPTGPMTALIAVLVSISHDQLLNKFSGVNPEHFINITIIMSGIILILMGLLRLGKFIKYIPNVVISGFMNGIAVIIWLSRKNSFFWRCFPKFYFIFCKCWYSFFLTKNYKKNNAKICKSSFSYFYCDNFLNSYFCFSKF